MPALTGLQQNRRIVQDFTLTTLAGIPTLFGRLVYVASLRDLSSGRYEHAGLAALYPEEALQQARAGFGNALGEPVGGFSVLSGEYAGWLAGSGPALVGDGGVQGFAAGECPRLFKRSFLLECPRPFGNSRRGTYVEAAIRVTTPVTRPTTSASFGVSQDSGMQLESG